MTHPTMEQVDDSRLYALRLEALSLAAHSADGPCRRFAEQVAPILDAYAATLKAAQGGVSEAMYRGAVQAWIDRAELDFPARLLAALEAALSAEPAAQGEAVALNVRHPKCHEAANAFWNYWNANGETHKRGYYESTWGAINAALRMVGVRPHDYGDAPPAQPADSKVIGSDSQIKPGERVLEGWRDALRSLLDHIDAQTCRHESTHRGGAIWTICDDCGDKWADDKGGFKPYEDAPAVAMARALLATPAAPAEEGALGCKLGYERYCKAKAHGCASECPNPGAAR